MVPWETTIQKRTDYKTSLLKKTYHNDQLCSAVRRGLPILLLQSIYIRFKSIFFSNLAAQLPQFTLHMAIPCPCEGRNECTICQPLLCTTVLSIHSEDAWDGSFKVVEIYNPFRETEFFWGIQKRLLMPRNQLCHPEGDASDDLYAQKTLWFQRTKFIFTQK